VLLSRPNYLDLPAELVDRALSGQLTISTRGEDRDAGGLVEFHKGVAGFPWRSQAKWIGRQLALRSGLDPVQSANRAGEVFRTDIYRSILGAAGADLPGASEKVEGLLQHPTAVASASGRVILQRDAFMDGRVFDPYLG